MSISSADPTPRHAPSVEGVSSLQSGEGSGHFCKGSCASQGHGTCSKPLSQQCRKCLGHTIVNNSTLRTQAIKIAESRGWDISKIPASFDANFSSSKPELLS